MRKVDYTEKMLDLFKNVENSFGTTYSLLYRRQSEEARLKFKQALLTVQLGMFFLNK